MRGDEPGPIVVKVGGSLFSLPGLGPRLRDWLDELRRGRESVNVILVPGGGATADVIRALDVCHKLGEETSHWLALRVLSLNAHVLAGLLPEARLTQRVQECSGLSILDPHEFARADEGHAGCLPHVWSATSDSVAARVAVVAGARELILLKSVTLAPPIDWEKARRDGHVDPVFSQVSSHAQPELAVSVVNLRTWSPSSPPVAGMSASSPC
jgi:aspartokinase-like uncharacterized kinase